MCILCYFITRIKINTGKFCQITCGKIHARKSDIKTGEAHQGTLSSSRGIVPVISKCKMTDVLYISGVLARCYICHHLSVDHYHIVLIWFKLIAWILKKTKPYCEWKHLFSFWQQAIEIPFTHDLACIWI